MGSSDIAAYPRSGYPDIASYLLTDALVGEIVTGLVLYPIAVFTVALLGSAAGIGRHRLAAIGTA